MKPEFVQTLLYAKEIKKHSDRKYVIVNRHEHVDDNFFKEKLSIILKVRAMENYCAVILDKVGMRSAWRKNYEWLVENVFALYKQ